MSSMIRIILDEDCKMYILMANGKNIVLLEVCASTSTNTEKFKFKFDGGGEYDMVIYDKHSHTCKIYEIKHSTEISDRQAIHLRNEEKCAVVEHRFGKITGKYVLYRGENTSVDEIQYLNVEQFLCELK